MYPRSAEKARESASNLEFCFAPDALASLVEHMNSRSAEKEVL